MRLLLLLLPAVSLLAQEAGGPRPNVREFLGLGPAPDAAAAKLGEQLYETNCATCHGKNARGSQGPNLIRSPLVLHDEKGEDIGLLVKKGRQQGGMPAFPDLSESQLYDLAEYLHMQVELAANRGTYRDTYGNLRNQVTGDAAQGQEFFKRHCANCHSVTGDLAHIGARFQQPSVLLSRIAWPVSPKPLPATVTDSSGKVISGLLVKLDDFDAALRDKDGRYYSWPRTEVKVDTEDPLAGHRALLPVYRDSDLHNLTAYLVNLK